MEGKGGYDPPGTSAAGSSSSFAMSDERPAAAAAQHPDAARSSGGGTANNPSSSPSSAAAASVPSQFPDKLMALLDKNVAPDAVWWLKDIGSVTGAFAINRKVFSEKLLDVAFNGNKFPSITRNLNRWAYKQLSYPNLPPQTTAYFNPLFQRGRPDLLKIMVQDKSKAKAAIQQFELKNARAAGAAAPTESSSIGGSPRASAMGRSAPPASAAAAAPPSTPEDINTRNNRTPAPSCSRQNTDSGGQFDSKRPPIGASLRDSLFHGSGEVAMDLLRSSLPSGSQRSTMPAGSATTGNMPQTSRSQNTNSAPQGAGLDPSLFGNSNSTAGLAGLSYDGNLSELLFESSAPPAGGSHANGEAKPPVSNQYNISNELFDQQSLLLQSVTRNEYLGGNMPQRQQQQQQQQQQQTSTQPSASSSVSNSDFGMQQPLQQQEAMIQQGMEVQHHMELQHQRERHREQEQQIELQQQQLQQLIELEMMQLRQQTQPQRPHQHQLEPHGLVMGQPQQLSQLAPPQHVAPLHRPHLASLQQQQLLQQYPNANGHLGREDEKIPDEGQHQLERQQQLLLFQQLQRQQQLQEGAQPHHQQQTGQQNAFFASLVSVNSDANPGGAAASADSRVSSNFLQPGNSPPPPPPTAGVGAGTITTGSSSDNFYNQLFLNAADQQLTPQQQQSILQDIFRHAPQASQQQLQLQQQPTQQQQQPQAQEQPPQQQPSQQYKPPTSQDFQGWSQQE